MLANKPNEMYTEIRKVIIMFADRVKALRLSRNLTRAALGEVLGVSHTAVYKWETGQSQPDIGTLQKLSDLFGVSLDELCDHSPRQTGDDATVRNLAVMSRAFRQMTVEEQEKYIAVGRSLFEHAFGGDTEE